MRTATVGFVLAAAAAGFVLGRVSVTLPDRSAAAREASESATGVVTGIGGVFFKVRDPDSLRLWYRRHLGIDAGPTGANFFWHPPGDHETLARTVWTPFPEDTPYFGDSGQRLMINYRVRDLQGLLERVAAEGVTQVGEVEEYSYGTFAWILDGEGNRVELWEPVDTAPGEIQGRMPDR